MNGDPVNRDIPESQVRNILVRLKAKSNIAVNGERMFPEKDVEEVLKEVL